MSATTAIENHFNQISLTNSDGYAVTQYTFIDLESAIDSYGLIANSVFVLIDANISFLTIAPIVLGDQGLYGDAAQRITVFPDEVCRAK